MILKVCFFFLQAPDPTHCTSFVSEIFSKMCPEFIQTWVKGLTFSPTEAHSGERTTALATVSSSGKSVRTRRNSARSHRTSDRANGGETSPQSHSRQHSTKGNHARVPRLSSPSLSNILDLSGIKERLSSKRLLSRSTHSKSSSSLNHPVLLPDKCDVLNHNSIKYDIDTK